MQQAQRGEEAPVERVVPAKVADGVEMGDAEVAGPRKVGDEPLDERSDVR